MLFLINKISEPLAYIMRWLYSITENYAVALFLFALIAAIICLPLTILSRRNMIIKAKMSPELTELQKKFAKPKDAPVASPDKTLEEREAILAADRERQKEHNQAIADVYMKHGYKPWGNWIAVVIKYIFIIAVFGVVTSPLTHICSLPDNVTDEIIELASTYNNADTTSQLQAFEIMKQNFDKFSLTIPEISSYFKTVDELPNLSIFDGYIDMAGIPSLKHPSSLLFFPAIVYIAGFIQTALSKLIESYRLKKSKINHKKKPTGMLLAELASIVISPLLLTYFAFKVPPMLSLYYVANTIISTFISAILAFAMPLPYIKNPQEFESAETPISTSSADIENVINETFASSC